MLDITELDAVLGMEGIVLHVLFRHAPQAHIFLDAVHILQGYARHVGTVQLDNIILRVVAAVLVVVFHVRYVLLDRITLDVVEVVLGAALRVRHVLVDHT